MSESQPSIASTRFGRAWLPRSMPAIVGALSTFVVYATAIVAFFYAMEFQALRIDYPRLAASVSILALSSGAALLPLRSLRWPLALLAGPVVAALLLVCLFFLAAAFGVV